MISNVKLDRWRKEAGEAMTSALDEYCPPEFEELLDAYQKLEVVYQIRNFDAARCPGMWNDATEEAYYCSLEKDRRVVYVEKAA